MPLPYVTSIRLFTYLVISGCIFLSSMAPASAIVYWSNGDFSTGDFTQWSYAQGPDPTQGGPGPQYCYVTNQAKSGIAPHSGTYFAHFERPASATCCPHAKVYKEWSNVGKLDQWRRVEDPIFNNGNVSAIYSAWFYFPASYTIPADWVNIFQFKEMGFDRSGNAIQFPSWWVNVGQEASFAHGNVAMETSTPVLFVNYWGNNYVNFNPKLVPLPLGRWFQLNANLYQGDRIEWYIDGKRFDTSYNSTYPVGRFYPVSTGWILGVGHYGGIGTLYVGHVGVGSLQ
jgi:hypothetical protein